MDGLTITTIFSEYGDLVWLFVGFALIALELIIAPGIGLLFAGFGAITIGGLIAFNIVDLDIYQQITYFLGLSILWTLILWKPIKKYLRSSTGIFDMYAGTIAVVQEGGIGKEKTGKVRWSGTDMRARIIETSEHDKLPENTETYVHLLKDGVMYVDTVKAVKKHKEK